VLLVPVPAAAAIVHVHRLLLDPSAAAGVPEHVTLLYPFLPPDQINASIHERLARLADDQHKFPFQLTAIRWFEDRVMWLEPEPAAPFIELTQLLVEEFGLAPYGGAYAEITPHLTVAAEGSRLDADRAAAAIAQQLPIATVADRVYLMTGSTATRWQVGAEYRLGAA
jgi:2'-5' RNA ligase